MSFEFQPFEGSKESLPPAWWPGNESVNLRQDLDEDVIVFTWNAVLGRSSKEGLGTCCPLALSLDALPESGGDVSGEAFGEKASKYLQSHRDVFRSGSRDSAVQQADVRVLETENDPPRLGVGVCGDIWI